MEFSLEIPDIVFSLALPGSLLAVMVGAALFRLVGYGVIILSAIVLLLTYRPMDWTRQRLRPTPRPGEAVGLETVAL